MAPGEFRGMVVSIELPLQLAWHQVGCAATVENGLNSEKARVMRLPAPRPPWAYRQAPTVLCRVGLMALAVGNATAQAQQVPVTEMSQVDKVLTTSRAGVRGTTEWVARHVDSWFGDKPFSDGGGVYDGQVSLNLLHRQDTGTDWNLGFNARFRLPNVEKRSYVFIGRDNPDEVVADTPREVTRRERLLTETADQRSVFAGLGIALRDALDLRVGVKGGLKPYAQARYRKVFYFGAANNDRVEFRETFFWSLRDRLGATTSLSYEHPLTTTLAFRWLNTATITQASLGWSWVSSAGVVKLLGHRRTVSLEALVSGQRIEAGGQSEVGVQSRWQQPVHQDWLLGHVVVGHFWPRRHDGPVERERSWALGAGLTMLF